MPDAKPKNTVKAVFFDLFDTLARCWPPREEIQKIAWQEFGIALTARGVDEGYALADNYMASENASGIPVRNRTPEAAATFFAEYERLVLLGAGVHVDQKIARRVWARIQEIPYGLALFDDVIPTLKRLTRFGVVTGLISNINRGSAELLQTLGLIDYIGFAITSKEVGAEKPNAAIFEAALAAAGTTPSQTVHVGDQYLSDIVGALGVGIQPILIDRYQTAGTYEGIVTIHTLEEVVQLLEGVNGKCDV